MAQVQLQYLFQDKPYCPEAQLSDYDTLNIISAGCRLYGSIMWPDGSYSAPRPCVVLLHGFPGSAPNDDLTHALCRIGCVVLTPHHRGAWGSEGNYLVSNCIEDTINIAGYVRSEAFCRQYNVDPNAIFLMGHSMGGNTVIHASKSLPWLRGIAVLTPYDPMHSLRAGREEELRELLEQGVILHSEGLEAIFQDILAHQGELGFEKAFEALKDQNVFCAAGSRDACAPAGQMFLPLWSKLQAHETKAVQRFVEYPAGHGLLGCRSALIREVAQFLLAALEPAEGADR